MTRMKLLFVALGVAAAVSMAPMANAAGPVLHFSGTGSSAMYQQFALTAVNELAATSATCAGGINVVGGCAIHHFTIKGSCADSVEPGTPCVGIVDGRNHAIPVESATYWVAWVCPVTAVGPQVDCNGSNATDAWYYDQVDSTVGVRTYLANATTAVAPGVQTGADPAGNLIKAVLFLNGDATGACGAGFTTCDAAEVPADVYSAINGSVLNTGMTDTRPEDALFATKRANSTSTLSPWTGLGYGGGPNTLIGASIASAFTQTFATPVSFALPGQTDPFTNNEVPPTIGVIPVGEEVIVLITNRRNANGLGNLQGGQPWYNNAVDNAGVIPYSPSPIGQLFGGVNCNGSSAAIGNYPTGGPFTAGLPTGLSDFAVNPILRESLSGTMNTTEFGLFRTYGGSLATVGGSSVSNSNVVPTTSQESNLVAVAGNAPVNPLGGPQAANPPGQPCNSLGGSGLGKRYRAIGTGEEVGHSAAACSSGFTGVGCEQDSIGYTFYSFANVSPLANNADYGYLQVDGVDPIFANYAGGDPGQPATGGFEQGELPGCTVANNGAGQPNGPNGTGGCLTTDVWTGGTSFPNVRNGTYRAWSILRAMCDTNASDLTGGHCLTSQDPLGTEALVASAQDDIHTNNLHSEADLVPFNDGSLGVHFGLPGGFGDAKFARSHYAFQSSVGVTNNQYPGSHITPSFSIFPAGLNADQPLGTAGSPEEAGGDAGGCIVPANVLPNLMTVTGAFGTNPGTVGGTNYTKMKLNYNPLSAGSPAQVPLTGVCGPGAPAAYLGHSCTSSFLNAETSGATIAPTLGVNCGNAVSTCNPPSEGMSVAVTGFAAADNADNGAFQVTRILYDGQIKVRYEPAVTGKIKTVSGATGVQASANSGCSQ